MVSRRTKRTHIKRDGKTICKVEDVVYKRDTLNTISFTEMHRVKKDKYPLVCPKCLEWYFNRCKKELIIIED